MTENVITLLGEALTEETVAAAAREVAPVRKEWIVPGHACDLFIAEMTPELEKRLGGLGLPVDWVVQPVKHQRKQLLIADMDSTIITVECLDELADFVGRKAEVAEITARAMNGELEFEPALKERVALLEGLPEDVLQQCYNERVRFTPGARELVQTMRGSGAYCVLVSGGFTFFTSRVAEAVGFHEHHANRLEIMNGKLTGRVMPPILGKQAKREALERLLRERDIKREDVLAVGDGANDLPMLLAAGLGIAYYAKPAVQAQARHRINRCDLRALLWMQGLRDAPTGG